MLIQTADFNGADKLFASGAFLPSWNDVAGVLSNMPLHLKASDQAGIQGSYIFDPVGTNEHLKAQLLQKSWAPCLAIPSEFAFLGRNVDFAREGVLLEAQFSNYPFLLNNLLRTELLYRSKTPLAGVPTQALIVITKAKLFPSSNSTLYFEQAVSQVCELSKHSVFLVPVRLVGLFESVGSTVPVAFTEYHTPRYSRTVVKRTTRKCAVMSGPSSRSCVRLALSD